ncbi:hypothetical protein GCM10008066_29460 [Oxalicibacterium faecigallinarum]|uniref:EAL domain-containing protein n=1 Tax=Oxalicibacterium faecigallinarum TaxID=573741 RepID=A0A8J3F7M8_9BURK|nr:hypothetical protein GCM10008066_29460 [Oxalicibacterium faecigallinarum]
MFSLFLWPIIFLILVATVWIVALDEISDIRNNAEQDAMARAQSISRAYSEQLTRSVQQIDAVTLNVKYLWEKQGMDLDLREALRRGLLPPQLYITIVDRNGMGVTSSLGGAPIDVSDREYFQFHKAHQTMTLRVAPKLEVGRRSGKTIVRFTRRLETANGAFDGVITVGVDPTFLASFNDEGALNPHDFISIRHEDGALLVSEKGNNIRGSQVHINPPVFATDHGVMLMDADKYKDQDARILAWHKLMGYPLISYAGLSESDVLAKQKEVINSYRQFAELCTVLFLLIAAIGTCLSIRMAARKQQADEIRQTYQLAVDEAREGFFTMRALYRENGTVQDFVIEDCNTRGASMARYSKSSLIGKRLSEFSLLQDLETALSAFRHAMETGFFEDEFEVSAALPGAPQWVHRRLIRSGKGLAVTLRDISETKESERLLIKSANTDALTGLPNRYWLVNSLPTLLRVAGHRNKAMAVLFIDLDDFKQANDRFGHAVGDKLLKMAAERLKSVIRAGDEVVRLGGDEFTVLLSTIESTAEAERVASRITEAFTEPFRILGHSMNVGSSIGISLFPEDGLDADTLIQKADIAMYASKSDHKGIFRFYNDELYQSIRSKLDAEEELRYAIAKKQFFMVYQPRVDTRTGDIRGFEALVRWQHPTRGIVPPAQFIELAESTGSIVPLGSLVMDCVFRQIAAWQNMGETPVPISLNISPRQLDAGGVDQQIKDLMKRHKVSADLIEIELTESVMMSEVPAVIDQITAIRQMGIKLHLDDFGTGYSSLSRLQEIEMQVIKIDRAFVSRLGTSSQADVLVKTIVLMAKELDMSIIAEGVETIAQLETLQHLDCDEAQGYLIAKPVTAPEARKLLQQRRIFMHAENDALPV